MNLEINWLSDYFLRKAFFKTNYQNYHSSSCSHTLSHTYMLAILNTTNTVSPLNKLKPIEIGKTGLTWHQTDLIKLLRVAATDIMQRSRQCWINIVNDVCSNNFFRWWRFRFALRQFQIAIESFDNVRLSPPIIKKPLKNLLKSDGERKLLLWLWWTCTSVLLVAYLRSSL